MFQVPGGQVRSEKERKKKSEGNDDTGHTLLLLLLLMTTNTKRTKEDFTFYFFSFHFHHTTNTQTQQRRHRQMAALQAARKLALETQSLLVQYEQGNASSKPIVEAKLEQLQQIVKEIQKDKGSMAPGSLAGLFVFPLFSISL